MFLFAMDVALKEKNKKLHDYNNTTQFLSIFVIVLLSFFLCSYDLGIVQGALKTERENRNAWLSWNESPLLIVWEK